MSIEVGYRRIAALKVRSFLFIFLCVLRGYGKGLDNPAGSDDEGAEGGGWGWMSSDRLICLPLRLSMDVLVFQFQGASQLMGRAVEMRFRATWILAVRMYQ